MTMTKKRDAWLREVVERRLFGALVSPTEKVDAAVNLVRSAWEMEDRPGESSDLLEEIALVAGAHPQDAKEFAEEVRAGLRRDPLYQNSWKPRTER